MKGEMPVSDVYVSFRFLWVDVPIIMGGITKCCFID